MQALEIAVIIPVKNRADLLALTLQNLMSQTLPPTEICVVDDHSTDHVAEVVARFAPTAWLIPNPGQGPGAARNAGLAATKAPFIQFFDSDDLITLGKMEAQAQALQTTTADMAYGPYVKAEETQKNEWRQRDSILQYKALPSDNLEQWLLRGWNAITQSMMFRRSFLEQVPPWEETLITTEDYLYMTRLSGHKPSIVHVPSETVIYRQHGLQSTGDHIRELGKAKNALQVLETIYTETDWTSVDWLTHQLFLGRLYLAEQFSHTVGATNTPPQYSEYKNAALLYRLYNKFERFITRTPWERMHGVSKDPEHFTQVITHLS